MPTSSRSIALFPALFAIGLVLVGCAVDAAGDDEDDGNVSADADLTSTVTLEAGSKRTIMLDASSTKDMSLTIDCAPPEHPDDRGPVLEVLAPTLGIDGRGASPSATAGYFHRTGSIASGQHAIMLKNLGATARCQIKTLAVPSSASCRVRSEWRSANTDHTHYRVGEEGAAAGWDAFPASGNHWGAWAKWNTVYEKPVKTGFLLHNLEHGGLVLSYKCSSAATKECADARDKLVEIARSVDGQRVLITPDPSQPEMFAIRGWRYAYSSSCFDLTSAKAFARDHYRRGREDADADPPIPYDPTTLDVPCEDLMAAPDSCGR